MDKNYRIIKRVTLEYKQQEKDNYKIRASKNKEKLKEIQDKYRNKNRKIIYERRQDRNDFYFSI